MLSSKNWASPMVERAEETRVELLRIWEVSMEERAEVAALAAAVRLAEDGMGLPSLEPLMPHGVKESILDDVDGVIKFRCRRRCYIFRLAQCTNTSYALVLIEAAFRTSSK